MLKMVSIIITQVQSEMSVFRNRLTVAESKNTLLEQVSFSSSFLWEGNNFPFEQEKADLSEAVVQLQHQQKAEPQGKRLFSCTISNVPEPTCIVGRRVTSNRNKPLSESDHKCIGRGGGCLLNALVMNLCYGRILGSSIIVYCQKVITGACD